MQSIFFCKYMSPLTQLRVRFGESLTNPAHPSPQGRGWLSHRRSRVRGVFTLLISGFFLLSSSPANAACTNPTGTAGQIRYNEQWRVPQYCNDTSWVSMRRNFRGDALDRGLIGHWELDESAGIIASDSVGSTTGDVAGVAAWLPTGGIVGGAFDFDGATHHIQFDSVAERALFEVLGDHLTIAAWIKTSVMDSEKNEIVYEADGNVERNYDLHFDDGILGFRHGDGATDEIFTATTVIADGQWHHVAAVVNYPDLHFYVDGVQDGTTKTMTFDLQNPDTGQSFNIGGDTSFATTLHDSLIDDVRLYDRSLSAGEMTQLASMGPDPSRGLVGHWPLDEGQGTTAYDSGSGGNNGTYENTPNYAGGIVNGALDFDGEMGNDALHDRVDIGDPGDGSLDFGTGDFSYGLWYYGRTDAGTWDMPWYKGGGSALNAGYDMELGTGSWNACQGDGDENFCTQFSSTPLNQWVHLFVTVDRTADLVTTYLDGTAGPTSAIAGTVSSLSSTNNAAIGATDSGNHPMDGYVDDVRVYDRVLSPTEISVLAGCTAPVGQRGAIVYNDDQNVMQYCDGEAWQAMGPVPGAGGAGCTSPTKDEGAMIYNADFNIMQYCDGAAWVPLGASKYCSGPTNGLVGHWKLDETSGTNAADATANGNDGTLTNMSPPGDWVTGTKSGALDFDGGDDTVTVTNDPAIDTDNFTGLTASAWIYPRTTGENSEGRIVDKSDNTGALHDGWRFQLGDGGGPNRLSFTGEFSTTDLYHRSGDNVITLNTWQHVLVTWDKSTTATNAKIYVDGTEVPSYLTATDGVGTFTDTWDLYIGNIDTPVRTFDGIIDDVRVYDRVLGADEITNLANGGGCL